MEILVCIKRVPDIWDNEIEVNRDGTDIKRDDLVYSINEWDNYAVEEAIQIRDKVGGTVTVITVGDNEDEEILRRQLAMGADQAILISDDGIKDRQGKGVATLLKVGVSNGDYDLILTGVQAEDGSAQVGGMLAAMLDWPFASIVNQIEINDENKIIVGRELAGGIQERNEIELPAVLSIQTGINSPRYVGIRGVRKAASIEISMQQAADLSVSAELVGPGTDGVRRRDYFVPDPGESAEMIEGSTDEIIGKLVELLQSKGGIK